VAFPRGGQKNSRPIDGSGFEKKGTGVWEFKTS